MQTIDEISIGRDGDMFTLTIYAYNPDDPDPYEPTMRQTFVIGLPDQFHAETQRTIGQWLTPAVDSRSEFCGERMTPMGPPCVMPKGHRQAHMPVTHEDIGDYVREQWLGPRPALTHDAQGDND